MPPLNEADKLSSCQEIVADDDTAAVRLFLLLVLVENNVGAPRHGREEAVNGVHPSNEEGIVGEPHS